MNEKGIQILMVEDNPGDIRLTREIFKDAGLTNELTVLTNGVDALRALGVNPDDVDGKLQPVTTPDLIVIDLNLPGIDGRELVDIIKFHPELTDVPLVILTNSLDDRHLTVAHGLHAKSYVEKPLELDKLIGALQGYPQFGIMITRRA